MLISNVLLILFSLVYGFLIIKEKKKEDSKIWMYFLAASGLFFLSELLSVLSDLFGINIGLVRAFLRIGFGIIVLFAFMSKYSSLHPAKKKN